MCLNQLFSSQSNPSTYACGQSPFETLAIIKGLGGPHGQKENGSFVRAGGDLSNSKYLEAESLYTP